MDAILGTEDRAELRLRGSLWNLKKSMRNMACKQASSPGPRPPQGSRAEALVLVEKGTFLPPEIVPL